MFGLTFGQVQARHAAVPSHCQRIFHNTALLLLLTLQSCSLLPSSDTAVTEQQPVPAATLTETPPTRPFSEDTLYNLLVGELAVYDRDLATAAENYRREAIYTRDSAVAERAARLNRYLRDEAKAIEMAELWYELQPDDVAAADNLADLYARTHQPQQALNILEAQLRRGQPAKFGVLRNSQFRSDEELATVIHRLGTLDTTHPDHNNFSLIFTHTLLLQKNGQTEAALKQLHELERFESDPVQLALIESQLLSELQRDKEAAQVLAKARKKFPDERRLAVAHARKLTKLDMPQAEKELAALLNTDANDVELLMTHALVAAENGHFSAAQESLEQLLALEKKTSFAHYNLGLIAEQQDDLDGALTHFEQVSQGQHFLSAIQRIVGILERRNQIEEARQYLSSLRSKYPMLAPSAWGYEAQILSNNHQNDEAIRILSSALLQFPEQHPLRLQRAYISDNVGNTEQAEADLRYVLERDPNNVNALNALGYILADRTSRYLEARDLIEKALKLAPDNPAIIDSLGWVLFKQGELAAAQQQLKKAFNLMPDDEVAAHLIEAYWVDGKRGDAEKLYKKLRKHTTVHPKVDATLQRLNIQF